MKKKRKTDWHSRSSINFLKVLAVIFAIAVLVVGFIFLDKYVKKVTPAWGETIHVELTNPPAWINQSLINKIIAAAKPAGENIKLEEDTARSIQNNLQQDVAWLNNIKVRTTYDKILIEADYRKPLALVNLGQRKFYVDAELIELDFMPMPNLPIVNVKGLATIKNLPSVGEILQLEDLNAAVEILAKLDRMDKLVTPDKPLLYEIGSIDVSNFKGRKNSKLPHIILYTKDNTEIIWGAEIDAWAQHLEAKDEEKLAKLYNYYKEFGSLTGEAKYIDLRTPQGQVPLPIDKY